MQLKKHIKEHLNSGKISKNQELRIKASQTVRLLNLSDYLRSF